VDFGQALAVVNGVECTVHFFALDLPHSDAIFVMAFPAESTEAFVEGHIRGFAYFDGVPRSILYDNTKLAVAQILGDGTRQKTRVFSELQSHYLFAKQFGRPAKGNDKGNVEGLVGYARRNFLVPVPRVGSWEELNQHLLAECSRHRQHRVRGQQGTIAERFERDRDVPGFPATCRFSLQTAASTDPPMVEAPALEFCHRARSCSGIDQD
jgi:transposase